MAAHDTPTACALNTGADFEAIYTYVYVYREKNFSRCMSHIQKNWTLKVKSLQNVIWQTYPSLCSLQLVLSVNMAD